LMRKTVQFELFGIQAPTIATEAQVDRELPSIQKRSYKEILNA
jgi:hypothetical protein